MSHVAQRIPTVVIAKDENDIRPQRLVSADGLETDRAEQNEGQQESVVVHVGVHAFACYGATEAIDVYPFS